MQQQATRVVACPICGGAAPVPSRKELKIMRKEIRRASTDELERIHHNTIVHRPWWMPRFLWGRIVSIVLTRGQAGE